MPIYNLTKDKIDEFNDLLNKKLEEESTLKGKDNKRLWLDDLDVLHKKITKNFKNNTKKTFIIKKK